MTTSTARPRETVRSPPPYVPSPQEIKARRAAILRSIKARPGQARTEEALIICAVAILVAPIITVVVEKLVIR